MTPSLTTLPRFAFRTLLPALVLVSLPVTASGQTPAASVQVAAAVSAAPAGDRDAATVLGFGADGAMRTLRQGSNGLICLADDPNREGWSVACYHESLDPFMARGRAEADAGTLAMPDKPATLYVMTGEGFDVASGTVTGGFLRWVIYTPYATPESTGLSPMPGGPGAPWLMFPGTAGAHIMITPPMPGGGND